MKYIRPETALLAAFASLAACSGSIATSADDETPPPGVEVPGGPPLARVDDERCKNSEAPVLRRRLWRLSAKQYANTVKAVFGTTIDPSIFPLAGVTGDGVTSFDTNADANPVNDEIGRLYNDSSKSIARAMVTRLASSKSCLLASAPAADCVRDTLADWATRAYRRPVSRAEADRLAGFHAGAREDYGAENATRMAFEAIMQSPHFLYRAELGEAQDGDDLVLTPYELASELSYFLTDGPPDEELMEAAASGALASMESRRAHAQRLLASPLARTKLGDFFFAHLGLKKLVEGGVKDAELFPMFDEALRTQVTADARAAIEIALFDGQGTFEALLTGPIKVSPALANTFGGDERPGIIAHPAVLAALSNEASTSPVHRGLFYFQNLMCNPLPVPPPDASIQPERLVDPDNPNGNQRDQWAYFEKSAPECAGCHRLFHPLGLALENYDPIGRLRVGDDIDLSVTLEGVSPELDGHHEDGVALADAIARSPIGRACLALQLSAFGFGRTVDPERESCQARSLVERFSQRDLDVKSLWLALTEERTFTHRRASGDAAVQF